MAADQIAALLIAQATNPLALLAIIIGATLVLEDAATVAVGLAASHGFLPLELALAGLVVGTIAGDLALHLIGRSGGSSPYGRRLRTDPRVVAAEAWLSRRQVTALATARFVPGLRLPIYAASGFLKLPLGRTALVMTLMTLVWTPALFLLSHQAAGIDVGPAGWALAALLMAATFVAPTLIKRSLT